VGGRLVQYVAATTAEKALLGLDAGSAAIEKLSISALEV